MERRPLHIAWLGGGPRAKETGGAPGVATDLLHGLARRGHRIDCILGSERHPLPERLQGLDNLTFVWSRSSWRWGAWYNRIPGATFVTGLIARGLAAVRLRGEVARRHRADPYDLVFQFNNIEAPSLPAGVRRSVPVVFDPGTHMQGELRHLIRERRLALRCGPPYMLAVAIAMTWLRARVQRRSIRHAALVICISSVFREHLVRDYRVPRERTVVIPNPLRLERFDGVDLQRPLHEPPAVLVLGRITVRKGIEDVIEIARALQRHGSRARIRVIGRASLFSNYIPLLSELPDNAEFAGSLAPEQVPEELKRTDLLLQASRYEPFGLTVAEALACGVPVVATCEVGAAEGVDERVCAVLAPGDVEGMTAAVERLLADLHERPGQLRALARAEAERLFAADEVCERVEAALFRATA